MLKSFSLFLATWIARRSIPTSESILLWVGGTTQFGWAVSVALGVAMAAETLLFLWVGWSRFGLATSDAALYTFSFLMLLYFAVFSVVSARERSWFWANFAK